ncbi:MAG: hypothetical protein KAT05_11510, partial [Spirochaetes bacterium]|nr:hypothetical protein [Spirochaetota bacterium]
NLVRIYMPFGRKSSIIILRFYFIPSFSVAVLSVPQFQHYDFYPGFKLKDAQTSIVFSHRPCSEEQGITECA